MAFICTACHENINVHVKIEKWIFGLLWPQFRAREKHNKNRDLYKLAICRNAQIERKKCVTKIEIDFKLNLVLSHASR